MQTTLIKTEPVEEGTRRLWFTHPEGFQYKAGQSIDLTLVNPPETDAEGNTRAYSLVSIPSEHELSITTRVRDTAFKRVLEKLEPGATLEIEGPFGSFFLHENTARAAVFLMGGIGVTPAYSMIRDAAARGLPHKTYLFYSNRRPEDAMFLEEFQSLAATHPNFVFVPTMTQIEQSAEVWEGERGYITAELIKKYASEATTPIYYLAGPAEMVVAMRTVLNGMGVSNDDIRTEEFSGY
jgi:ferredoxin-NADP reductase